MWIPGFLYFFTNHSVCLIGAGKQGGKRMERSTAQGRKAEQPYMQATGRLPYSLTNDYMFKALLQKNRNVLKHLICSLLHLRPEEVESVSIRNPIMLGESVAGDFDSKIFVLDLNVLLNNRVLINLEMQVINYENWPERSLTYLCRNFDQLSRGEDYAQTKPAIHIGFLDFTLVPEHPEFYATYKVMNEKNHHILTDKFVLSMVDLKHIELATEEDRKWQIDYWASLFKAATWEEMKMLAKQSTILADAVETIYELTADEAIREQCTAREKHVREMKTIIGAKERAERAKEQAEKEAEQTKKKAERTKKEAERAKKEAERAKKEAERTKKEAERAKKEAEQVKESAEQEKGETIRKLELEMQQRIDAEQRNDQLLRKNDELAEEKDHLIHEKTQLTQQLEQLMQEIKCLKEQQTS